MSLWVHGPVRPNTLTIIFQCGPTVNGVWTCMRSDHCRGPVSKHEFYSWTWFKCDRSFHRNIKWWNRNAFQSGLFYGIKTESAEGTRDNWKKLFTRGLLYNQFFRFLGDKIGLITSEKNIIFVPLPRLLSEITHLFPSKVCKFGEIKLVEHDKHFKAGQK